MYRPNYFAETDRDTIISFIEEHPFATVIINDGVKNFATQIPVLLAEREEKLYIRGHVYRRADHYPALAASKEVLLLFTGADCYVSASWYSKRGQASTWNYMTVQLRGTITMLGQDDTYNIIEDLTHQYEDEQENPELTEDMSDEYISENLKAIAGFEIAIADIDATFKLNQNKDNESYKNVVEQLMATNDINSITIAGEMMKLRPELFA